MQLKGPHCQKSKVTVPCGLLKKQILILAIIIGNIEHLNFTDIEVIYSFSLIRTIIERLFLLSLVILSQRKLNLRSNLSNQI